MWSKVIMLRKLLLFVCWYSFKVTNYSSPMGSKVYRYFVHLYCIQNYKVFVFILTAEPEICSLWMHAISNHVLFITLVLKQDGRDFSDDIFKCMFLKENIMTLMHIQLKYVSGKSPLVQAIFGVSQATGLYMNTKADAVYWHIHRCRQASMR